MVSADGVVAARSSSEVMRPGRKASSPCFREAASPPMARLGSSSRRPLSSLLAPAVLSTSTPWKDTVHSYSIPLVDQCQSPPRRPTPFVHFLPSNTTEKADSAVRRYHVRPHKTTMSLAARIVLAVFAALFGGLMVAVAPPSDKAPLFYAFAAFCFAIAIVCVAPGRIAQFFGSLVAAAVLVMGAFYFGSMLVSGPLFTGRRSDESLFNSVLILVVFGTPSAIYLWHARFGLGSPRRRIALRGKADGEA